MGYMMLEHPAGWNAKRYLLNPTKSYDFFIWGTRKVCGSIPGSTRLFLLFKVALRALISYYAASRASMAAY